MNCTFAAVHAIGNAAAAPASKHEKKNSEEMSFARWLISHRCRDISLTMKTCRRMWIWTESVDRLHNDCRMLLTNWLCCDDGNWANLCLLGVCSLLHRISCGSHGWRWWLRHRHRCVVVKLACLWRTWLMSAWVWWWVVVGIWHFVI